MFFKIDDLIRNIAYRIVILAICLIVLSLELIPTCCATSGAVIIFERENWLGPLDIGHVGIAIQLDDGTWIAGAIEGPGGWAGVHGTDDTSDNGGWWHVFETEEDVINEFYRDRKEPLSNNELDKIVPHDPYDQMKKITVQERDESDHAEIIIKDFPKGGFSVWTDTDCFTRAYDVMKAYGVDETKLGSREGIISPRFPKAFFDALPGQSTSRDSWMAQKIQPAQSNALDLSSPASADTSQRQPQNPQKTAQYSEPSTSQSGSSSGTFDAYSEGKRIVEEFFASGEAEVALQEGLLSSTEGSGESAGETSSEESNLAGINFTSIKLNSISVTTDSLGGVNFDLILKAEKAEGSKPGISIQNATRIGATAFLTGLDVPNYKFWVNLNPWEVDRIIDEELGQSEVGKIMLEADLQMKKDFSNYGSPCVNKTGKVLWSLLDKKREALVQQCMSKFPGQIYNTDNINFQSVTTHWIIPDKVYVYSNGTQISIINATLTINSESDIDRSSFQVRNQNVNTLSRGCTEELNRSAQEYGEYCENLEENMIQPYVVADINCKEKYKDLRDVYTALALAQWYKSNISPLTDIFRYSRGSSSFSALKPEGSWDPKDIWDKYVYSFKNGEYICWENSTIKSEGRTSTRSHRITTGGVEFDDIGDHLVTNEAMPPEVQEQAKKAIKYGIAESQNDVLFGYRLHIGQKKETQITSTLLGSQDSSQAINDSSEENRTTSETSLTSKEAQIQSNGTQSFGKAKGNTGLATCPDGWMGPDEDGECWQMQITGAE